MDTTVKVLPDKTDAPVGPLGPQTPQYDHVGQKRRMLNSVNRLRATG
jgi:hypothetical protein